MDEGTLKTRVNEPDIVCVDEGRTSQIMGFAVQTLRNWRHLGTGPPYYKVGRAVRYRMKDIISFMEARRVNPLK